MLPQTYLLRKFHRSTFRSKLVITYVFIIVIPVISAMFISGMQLYKQTNSDYEEILKQLDKRTNVTINDFFTNQARYSFFYLTDFKLNAIMEKTQVSTKKSYVADANFMHSSLEQHVLMNGNIAMISVLAPNGNLFGSKPENAGEIVQAIEEVGRDRLQSNHFVVHLSKKKALKEQTNHRISILRYLSDLNLNHAREGYAKIDIYNKAVENMLGGISDDGMKLGTIVLSGDTVVYNSNGTQMQQNQQPPLPLPDLRHDQSGHNQIQRLDWNGHPYLISNTINSVTGWTIIHYIPVTQITGTFLSNTLNYAFFSILALIAALGLAFFFHRYFVNPILKLSSSMKTVDSEHLTHTIIESSREDEIGRLINNYNAMIRRLKTSRESEITASSLQKKAELKMLQSQINPHFLYNTLNAIHSISELHRMDHISAMTKSLSSIYRYNVKHGDIVTVGQEIEQMKHYITIQQIRFFNKFEVEYDIDEDVLDCKIIKFLLQPIIENSFYHGLEPKGGNGLLRLSIKRRRQLLYISVYDDGVGIPEEKLNELRMMMKQDEHMPAEDLDTNFGMRNVYGRVKHFYGANCWMNVMSDTNSGTTISIHIPYNKENATHENTSR